MKQIFRFMGDEEFTKYLKGERLENHKKHFEQDAMGVKSHTESVGFTFLCADDFDPFSAYRFLSGIVDDAHLCVFYISDEDFANKLTKSSGEYHKPDGDYLEMFKATEYCTTSYDSSWLQLYNAWQPLFSFKLKDLEVLRELSAIKSSKKGEK